MDQVAETQYSRQNFEKQIEVLSELLSQENQCLYFEALLTFESLNQSPEFMQMETELNNLAINQDWIQMNKRLISYFVASDRAESYELHKHSAMKYYFCFTSKETNLLESPIAIRGIIHSLEKMREELRTENNSEADYLRIQNLKQIYLNLINFFSEGKIQNAMIESENLPDRELLCADKVFQNYNLKHYTTHSELKIKLINEISSQNFPQSFSESNFYCTLTQLILKSRITEAIHKPFLDLLEKYDKKFMQQNILSLIPILKIFFDNKIVQLRPEEFIKLFSKDLSIQEIANQILQIARQDLGTEDFILRLRQASQKEQSLGQLFSRLQENDEPFFNAYLVFLQNFGDVFSFEQAQKYIEKSNSFQFQRKKALLWSQQMIQCQEPFLFSINDFMRVDLNIDIQQLEFKICEEFKHNQKNDRDEFVYLLFEMIKNRLSFKPFIQKLYTSNMESKIQITQFNMFCYLLDSSDSELRSILYLACSAYMPVPLIAYRPSNLCALEQLQDERLQFASKVYNEILFSYEQYMGVLCFKVSSDKSRLLKGCTSLTNNIFNRQFELHSPYAPLANNGQVEIQFDYNFVKSKFIQIADIHGYLEGQELYTLMHQFNIFIVHCFKNDMKALENVIENIKEGSTIIVISHDSKATHPFCVEKQFSDKITVEYKINSVKKLEGIILDQFADIIKDKVNGLTKDWKIYQKDIHLRLKQYENFAHFCNVFNQINYSWQQQSVQRTDQQIQLQQNREGTDILTNLYNDQSCNLQANSLIKTMKRIQDFMKLIQQNIHEIKGEKILPLSEIFFSICNYENQICRKLTLKQEEIDFIRKKIQEQKVQIFKQNPSDLSNQILELLQTQDYHVGVVSLLAKLIKTVVNSRLEPLFKERARLQDQFSKELEEDQKKQLRFDKLNINQKIEKLQFSMEFLFREFFIKDRFAQEFSMNDPQTMQERFVPFEKYFMIAQKQISHGQPFEIIDGDNLRFIDGVYQKMQNDYEQNDRIFVISVIGPQSSGKSLLLNFLFGTQFQSSAGRCTKGVYGCLIDIRQQDQFQHYKKILLLDTEGIQNAENLNEGFDNRIVFYILCISNLVLVCNKGDMNSQMQEMIKIAIFALSEYKGLIINIPQVNIIMNMVPQIDKLSLEQTYKKLQDSLTEIGTIQQNSHLFLNIKQENVFMLPNAYSSQGFDLNLQINNTSLNFARKVQQLKDHIFKFMKEQNENVMSHSIATWFKFASNTWDRVNNFHDIDRFDNLEQLQQGRKLFGFINDIINEVFVIKKDEVQIKIELKADKVLQNYKGNRSITSMELTNLIKKELKEYQRDLKNQLKVKFETFCKTEKVQDKVSNIYQDYFTKLLRIYFLEWLNQVNSKTKQFFIVNSKENTDLQVIAKKYLQIREEYSKEEANHLFEQNWKEVYANIKQQLKKKRIIFDETSQNISKLYRSQIKDFGNREDDLLLLRSYRKSFFQESLIISNLKTKFETDFLFYTRDIKLLDQEKFFEQYHNIGKYVPQLNYYRQIKYRVLYNWEKVVKERFNFKKFQIILFKTLQTVQKIGLIDKFMNILSLSNKIPQGSTVQNIFQDIKNEGQIFMIEVTSEFEKILLDLENKFKKNYNESLGYLFFDEDIDYIKQDIFKFFKFVQKPKVRIIPRNKYQYFEIHNTLNFKSSDPENKVEFRQAFYFENCYFLQGIPRGFEVFSEFYQRLAFNNEIAINDIPLQDYMNQIQQPEYYSLRDNEITSMHAKIFFFNNLNHQLIIDNIQELIVNNIYRIEKDPKNEKEFQMIIACLKTSEEISDTTKFSTMDNNQIKNIVEGVNKIVKDIDSELSPFNLNVNDVGISALHQIAYTFLSSLYIEIRRIDELGPLYNFKDNKKNERDFFIAKLTRQDDLIDRGIAIKAADSLISAVKEKVKKEQILKFNINIDEQRKYFSDQAISSSVEDYIKKVSEELKKPELNQGKNEEIQQLKILCDIEERSLEKKEQVKISPMYQTFIQKDIKQTRILNWHEIILMYVQPHLFFTNQFEKYWADQQITIDRLKLEYRFQKRKALEFIITFFEKYEKLIAAIQIQNKTPDMDTQRNIDCNEKLFKLTLNKIFSDNFKQVIQQKDKQVIQQRDYLSDEIIINEDIEIVNQDHFKDFKIEDEYRGAIVSEIKNEEIQNLHLFIKEFIKLLKIEIDSQEELKDGDIVLDKQREMKSLITGCNEICPLCLRKCDVIHQKKVDDSNLDKHECKNAGHQILGFGGSYHEKTNFAITYGCHQMENENLIWHDKKWKRWETFTQEFPRWIFKSGDEKLDNSLLNVNKIVWNLIGPLICHHYRDKNPGCKLKFKIANEDDDQKTMYILVLDKSSSMKTDMRWDNLLAEAKNFLGLIKKDKKLLHNSSITIITYHADAEIICENQIPKKRLLKNLVLDGFGTDFDNPLIKVKEIIEKYLNDFDTLHCLFLSDGEGYFPKNPIDQIVKSQDIMSKFKITTVAFGADSGSEKILKKIAESFGIRGRFTKVLNPKELQAVLIQMIPNIYKSSGKNQMQKEESKEAKQSSSVSSVRE